MSNMRILLAEDSTIVLEIEKMYLQGSDASVFTASRAEDVLNVARKVRPGLICLSFGISSGGGEACCRELKADGELRTIPVVMVCAAEGEKQRAREAGCDAVISKPVDRREFLESCLSFRSGAVDDDERIPCRAFVQCTRNNESFFVLPWSGATLIKTSGQVTWVNSRKRPRNKRLPPGFGLNFQGIDPRAADQIDDYLQLIRKRLEE